MSLNTFEIAHYSTELRQHHHHHNRHHHHHHHPRHRHHHRHHHHHHHHLHSPNYEDDGHHHQPSHYDLCPSRPNQLKGDIQNEDNIAHRGGSTITTATSTTTTTTKPDGGWGWAVVFAALAICSICDGYTYSTNQFYEQFLHEYHQTETITSIYASVLTATIMCIAPFASGLIKVYGCRAVSILGALLAVIGMVFSIIFDQTIYLHIFTIGLLAGAGIGMVMLCQVVILTEWFERKYPLATGIAVCGSGFGMAVFAVISNHYISLYGWRGAVLILAGLMSMCIAFSALHCCPFCFTIFDGQGGGDLGSLGSGGTGAGSAAAAASAAGVGAGSVMQPFTIQSWCRSWLRWRTFSTALRETVNFRLLWTNVRFTFFTISSVVLSVVFFTPLIVTSDRIKRAGIGDDVDSTRMMVCFGLANGVGRVMFGWIALHFDQLWLYIGSTVAMGAAVCATTTANNATMMCFWYAVIGIVFGGNVCLTSVVLVEMLGSQAVTNAFGIVCFFTGFGALFGPPLLNQFVLRADTSKPMNHSSVINATITVTTTGTTASSIPSPASSDIYRVVILISGSVVIFSGLSLIWIALQPWKAVYNTTNTNICQTINVLKTPSANTRCSSVSNVDGKISGSNIDVVDVPKQTLIKTQLSSSSSSSFSSSLPSSTLSALPAEQKNQ